MWKLQRKNPRWGPEQRQKTAETSEIKWHLKVFLAVRRGNDSWLTVRRETRWARRWTSYSKWLRICIEMPPSVLPHVSQLHFLLPPLPYFDILQFVCCSDALLETKKRSFEERWQKQQNRFSVCKAASICYKSSCVFKNSQKNITGRVSTFLYWVYHPHPTIDFHSQTNGRSRLATIQDYIQHMVLFGYILELKHTAWGF